MRRLLTAAAFALAATPALAQSGPIALPLIGMVVRYRGFLVPRS